MLKSHAEKFGLACLVSCLVACGTEPAATERERLGVTESSIINGAPDAGHPMVVAYLHNGSICSSTIVAVKGSTGYALTAAHCVGSELGELSVGSDINAPTKKYTVTQALAHPGYQTSGLYDVAMLKFNGADGATPIMPVLTPQLDDLKSATTLDVIGFGKTEDGGGQVGVKHHKFLSVKDVTPLRLIYDQQAGGLCSGDSGGPSSYYPNIEYVAGVHSYVASNNGSCLVEGADIRVSPFVDTFIMPFINGQPIGTLTCDQCTEAHTANGLCSNAVGACYATKHCPSYQACTQGCKTNGCVVECKAKYPAGAILYDAIFACVCDTGCAVECEKASFCNAPQCGLSAAKPACQSCFEASCCAEAQACSENATCIDCQSSLVPGASCKADPVTQAYEDCLATSCSDACGIPSSSGGGPGATSAASGGGSSGLGGGDAVASSTNAGAGGAGPTGETITVSACSASAGRANGHANGWVLAGLIGAAWILRRERPRG